ncbi:MAG: hypothetical protein ACFB11_24420, partial [Paracoccaceae bacterium]
MRQVVIEMIAISAIKIVVVGTGAVMQPSEMAKLVISSASIQVLMFNETIAMSSATTIAVSQIFLSKTMVMVGTKTIRPNG